MIQSAGFDLWKQDEALLTALRDLLERGGTWTQAVMQVAAAGYPVPSDRSIRRFFHANEWFPYDRVEPTATEEIPFTATSDATYQMTVTALDAEGNELPAEPECEPTAIELLEEAGVEPEAYLEKAAERAFRAQLRVAEARYDAAEVRKLAAKEQQSIVEQRSFIASVQAAQAKPIQFAERAPIVVVNRGQLDVIVILADNHVGKLVLPEDCGEGFIYNKCVFLEYLARIEAECYETLRLFGQKGVRNIYPLFVGDNTDGATMRAGHPFKVDMSIGEQAVFACDAYAGFMLSLAKMGYAQVKGRAVGGNHGRVGRKLDDNPYADSHEVVMYQMLKRSLEGRDGHVSLYVGGGETDYFRIGEQKITMEHAHRATGGYGGSPIPAVRDRFATLRANNLIGDYDLAISAHFHQEFLQYDGGGRLLVGSGSMDGGDDYVCHTLGKDSSSSQWILAQHPVEGIVYTQPVRLAPRRRIGIPLAEAS